MLTEWSSRSAPFESGQRSIVCREVRAEANRNNDDFRERAMKAQLGQLQLMAGARGPQGPAGSPGPVGSEGYAGPARALKKASYTTMSQIVR